MRTSFDIKLSHLNHKKINPMKKLKEMGNLLSKEEQKSVNGGANGANRCRYGDSICCGTANWQCGVGPAAGGFYNASNGTCDCV